MRSLSALAVAATLVSASGATTASGAQGHDAGAVAGARQALEAFIAAWNTADNAELRRTLHFPFVSLGVGGATQVARQPEDFATDFDGLRSRQGWVRSAFDFDSLRILRSSPARVHCEIDFQRYNAEGTIYLQGRVMYVVTERDGRWGLEMRTGAGRAELEEGAREEAFAAARQAVLDFFTAFNAGNVDGVTRPLNYPHVFLGMGGRVAVAEDASAASVRPDFERMRAEQGWHMSTIDSLEGSYVATDKVHMEIVFSRWHPDGTRYWTVPALWILTRAGDHWGIQLRSLMPATFSTPD